MQLIEVIIYLVPAILVFLASYLIIRAFIKKEREYRQFELHRMSHKTVTPVRLQAYERIVIFLERISPESMLMRLNNPKETAGDLHTKLLKTIRAEYEHNLSQQIYVSDSAWEYVRSARSNIIKLINNQASQVDKKAPSFELSKKILEAHMNLDKSPTTTAIENLKHEMQHFF